jgi:hypothetical protein
VQCYNCTMLENVKELVIRALTPRISPMVYVMEFISVIIGFCFFTHFLVGHGESVLFANGALIPIDIWGGLLFFVGVITETGLYKKVWPMVSFGGLGGFALWLLATIDLLMHGHFYAVLVLSGFHMVFQAYIYLASSLGVLERQAINRYGAV